MRAAIIVAGGGSRRMGKDKAWLQLDGRTLLERVLDAVGPAVDLLVVAAAPGQNLPPLGSALRVDDPADELLTGPLTGVRVALELLHARGAETAYLGAVDLPFTSTDHVRFMLDQVGEGQGAEGAVPIVREGLTGDGIRQPLAAAVQVGPALDAARAMAIDGERALFRLFDRLDPIAEVEVDRLPEPRVLQDVDTPSEWSRLCSPSG